MTIWQQREQETRETELYEQIGRLKMELGWLKKKEWDAHRDAQRAMIEPTHPDLSIRRQCELIGLNRLGGKGAGDADPPSTTRGQIVQPNKIILGKYPGLCYHASRIAHLNQWTSLPGSVWLPPPEGGLDHNGAGNQSPGWKMTSHPIVGQNKTD